MKHASLRLQGRLVEFEIETMKSRGACLHKPFLDLATTTADSNNVNVGLLRGYVPEIIIYSIQRNGTYNQRRTFYEVYGNFATIV